MIAADVVMGSRLTGAQIARVLYRRSLLACDDLKSKGWEQHAEILSLAVRRAKVIYEVAINNHGRTYEEGKKTRGWDAPQVLWMIASMRVRA